nr:MAK10-like protein [Tanacetum cinerariifolium]
MSIPPQDEPSINRNVPVQVNKISSSCEICSGPHDTQYFIEDTEQAFVEYASSCNDKMGAHMHLASTDHIKEEELQNKAKKSKAKGKGIMKPNEAEYNDHKRTVEAKEEVEEESEKEL